METLKQKKETSAKVVTVCCCAAVAVEINKTENKSTQQEKTHFYRTLDRNAAISQLYCMDIFRKIGSIFRKSVMDTRLLTEWKTGN